VFPRPGKSPERYQDGPDTRCASLCVTTARSWASAGSAIHKYEITVDATADNNHLQALPYSALVRIANQPLRGRHGHELAMPSLVQIALAIIIATAAMQASGRFNPFGLPLTSGAALLLGVLWLYLGI
jgi:hypothetical protein